LSSAPVYTSTTRPLDALAAGIVVVLCLSWGFNQVATKLAIHDIPPLMQAAIRSFVAAFLIAAWCRLRGIPLFDRDGTLWFGLAAGALFAIEFILIYQGLLYTTATRACCSSTSRHFLSWLARASFFRLIVSARRNGWASACHSPAC
jgi:uncharacterized membrane protein